MTPQNLLDEFSSLPVDAQRQVADFVSFLRQKYQTETPIRSNDTEIRDDKFIGMWSDREGLVDSSEWVHICEKKSGPNDASPNSCGY